MATLVMTFMEQLPFAGTESGFRWANAGAQPLQDNEGITAICLSQTLAQMQKSP
ncbi:MAG: hypothetical protein ACK4E7_06150 [Permianibacter sp.]